MKKLLVIFSLFACISTQAQSWVPVDLNTTKNFLDVHFLDPENGWIVGSEGAIFRYYDKSWHELDAGTGITFNAVFMADTNDVWIAGEGGKIINYTPAGFQVYDSPTTKSLNDIYMVNNSKGWIVGADGTLLGYNGLNWDFEYIEPPNFFDTNHLANDDLQHIDFLDENFGVITGEWGSYLEYRDGWKDMISQNTQYFVSVLIIDTSLVYVSGFESNPLAQTHYIFTYGGGGFLYFNSLGAAWINSFKIINNNGWAVVSNGNILKFNGSEFELFEDKNVALNSLAFLNDTTGWIVGGGGTLLHFNSSSLDLPEDPLTENFYITPNPTRGVFKIDGVHNAELQILDVNGTLIFKGKTNTFDLGNYPDGLYFINVVTDKSHLTGKLIKKK